MLHIPAKRFIPAPGQADGLSGRCGQRPHQAQSLRASGTGAGQPAGKAKIDW